MYELERIPANTYQNGQLLSLSKQNRMKKFVTRYEKDVLLSKAIFDAISKPMGG